MIFAPGAKMPTVTINNPTCTIFPACITRIICHNASSPYVIPYYLKVILNSYHPSGYSLEPDGFPEGREAGKNPAEESDGESAGVTN